MNNFLKTKKGLEYLLKAFPSNMLVSTAIKKIEKVNETV